MENPDQVVTIKASREVIEQLKDWSDPVQIRIHPAGAEGLGWDMEVRPWPEKHDDHTLDKVHKALQEYGLETQERVDLITMMQNKGILFRERA